MIVFTDANYSGSLSTSKIVTKRYILYVGRALHPPQSEITAVRKLMQDSVRDFSTSMLKRVQSVCHKTCKENEGHSVDKEWYARGKEAH